MPQVNITGWRTGLQKVSMVQVLHSHLGTGLKVSKDYVDDVLAGNKVSITLDDHAKAEKLIEALEEVGAVAEMESD